MKRYLIQVKDYRSSDSSHRVHRFTSIAKNLNILAENMQLLHQHEIEILAVEDVVCDRCKNELQSYEIGKGICSQCKFNGY